MVNDSNVTPKSQNGRKSELANMKVTEGLKLQDIFFKKGAVHTVGPKQMQRNQLVEPIFVNKRTSGVKYQNFIPTFKFANAHEGNIKAIVPLKKGIFMTAATDGVLKFWEPLQNVSLATLNESEFGESIDFIIPVVG
jgi:hypothetical protein